MAEEKKVHPVKPIARMLKGGFAGYVFLDKDGTLRSGFVEADALRMILQAKTDDGEDLFGGAAWSGTEAKGDVDENVGKLLTHVAGLAVEMLTEE